MSRIRSKDTSPERKVRSILHNLGFRFRLHQGQLAGKPDIVLKKYSTVIFVHGCFWHQHQGCNLAYRPSSNIDYWNPKLKRNTERDKKNQNQLKRMGWRVLVVWECELRNPAELAQRLRKDIMRSKSKLK